MTEPPHNVSTDSPDPSNADYDASIASLRRAIEQFRKCDAEELHTLADDLAALTTMADKLEEGRVEIVVFGEISTGKGALINALVGADRTDVDVRGGWTKSLGAIDWEGAGYRIPGFGHSEVVLIDTPGLNEVDGEVRAAMAREAAIRADLVLFVVDSDLNDVEYRALTALAASHKPVLLVLNKTDLYRPEELDALLKALHDKRLAGVIDPDNILTAQADPREVQYVIEAADGSERTEWRKPEPKVDAIKQRIVEVLESNGKALVALNAALFASDKSDRMAAVRVRLRENRASATIWNFAVAKSLAVALNPVGVADVDGGALVDITMIVTLGRIYGISISNANARSLLVSIAKSAGLVTLLEVAVSWASSAFKALTGGLGTVLTGVPQGAAAGYGSFIVGQAARYYFQHGASWGEHGPKNVVRNILDNTDKASVIDRLKSEIRAKIAVNRHADGDAQSTERESD
ncbi:MAG: GTP-binding protein [Planctomycetales bacterium]|nr:GTP-binding protein [Planctomycetales bacterium]